MPREKIILHRKLLVHCASKRRSCTIFWYFFIVHQECATYLKTTCPPPETTEWLNHFTCFEVMREGGRRREGDGEGRGQEGGRRRDDKFFPSHHNESDDNSKDLSSDHEPSSGRDDYIFSIHQGVICRFPAPRSIWRFSNPRMIRIRYTSVTGEAIRDLSPSFPGWQSGASRARLTGERRS